MAIWMCPFLEGPPKWKLFPLGFFNLEPPKSRYRIHILCFRKLSDSFLGEPVKDTG